MVKDLLVTNESGKQVSHTTPSQDDGESFSDFWINPLNDAVNDPSTALSYT